MHVDPQMRKNKTLLFSVKQLKPLTRVGWLKMNGTTIKLEDITKDVTKRIKLLEANAKNGSGVVGCDTRGVSATLARIVSLHSTTANEERLTSEINRLIADGASLDEDTVNTELGRTVRMMTLNEAKEVREWLSTQNS